MEQNKIVDSILQASEMIADKKIELAPFDRTIRAVIEKRLDEEGRQYACKYQNSIFTAYSVSPSTIFKKGMNVYVLIPMNDMDKRKLILGSYDYQSPETRQNVYWIKDI